MWISVFLVLVIVFNMFPVRVSPRYWQKRTSSWVLMIYLQVFGELEYIFGCLKLIFITMLILVCPPPDVPPFYSHRVSLTSMLPVNVLPVHRPTFVCLLPVTMISRSQDT